VVAAQEKFKFTSKQATTITNVKTNLCPLEKWNFLLFKSNLNISIFKFGSGFMANAALRYQD
jgi:hypothetical protein